MGAAGPSDPGPMDLGPEDALTLRDLQDEVDAMLRPLKAGYWSPLENLARLTEEVGELARELNHRYGPKTKKASEPEASLALELADILFVVGAIANQTGVDLDDAFRATLQKYRTRDRDRWERCEGAAAPEPNGALPSGEEAGTHAHR